MNKTKHVLVGKEFKKLQTFDSSPFIGQSYFKNDEAQLYLKCKPLNYTLKRLGDTEKFVSWKSKGLIIVFLHQNKWYENASCCLIFKENCLKQQKRDFHSSKNNKLCYCL